MVTKASSLLKAMQQVDPVNEGRGTSRDWDQEKRLITARLESVGQQVVSIKYRPPVGIIQLGSLVLSVESSMASADELSAARNLLSKLPEVLKVTATALKVPEQQSWKAEYVVHFQ